MGSCAYNPGNRYPKLPRVENGALHVVNFALGQADAQLLIYNGKTLLLDCGSPLHKPHNASRRIPQRLDALIGSRHIDYFLITHYHSDHMGGPKDPNRSRPASGIYALIEKDGITIDTILDHGFWNVGKKTATQKHYERHVQNWIDRGIVRQRVTLHPGDLIDMGGQLKVEVISASGNGFLERLWSLFPTFIATAPPSENDYSVGVKATLGDFELFSAGDLSGKNLVRKHGPVSSSYTDIESRIADQIGSIEVYRVNHHGSAHSSNACFTRQLQPQVSVLSTGVNHYGHPDLEVFARLEQYGDVVITSGADARSYEQVKHTIVGDDIEVIVSPDGAQFWVNGKYYLSRSEIEEQQTELQSKQSQRCMVLNPKDDAKGMQYLNPRRYENQDLTGSAPSD